MAGECRPILELAGAEQRLVIVCKFERIGAFFGCSLGLRFGVRKAVPWKEGNDGGS